MNPPDSVTLGPNGGEKSNLGEKSRGNKKNGASPKIRSRPRRTPNPVSHAHDLIDRREI